RPFSPIEEKSSIAVDEDVCHSRVGAVLAEWTQCTVDVSGRAIEGIRGGRAGARLNDERLWHAPTLLATASALRAQIHALWATRTIHERCRTTARRYRDGRHLTGGMRCRPTTRHDRNDR